MKNFLTAVFLVMTFLTQAQILVSAKPEANGFVLAATNATATILYDEADDSLVRIAAQMLAGDVEKVCGNKPVVTSSLSPVKAIVIVGSIHKSGFIKKLIEEKKLNLSSLQNKWEGCQIQLIKSPFKGVEQALVIAGSDRRGTAYGVAELSKQIGVSPWHWWADVPVKRKKEIYLKAGVSFTDAPAVKYRGIFINDEAPALSNWSKEKFGGFNHKFYGKVFELMLRLKANYLWPAMWGNAFYDDDSLNRQTADAWGIVIGTSHHEPLMRAHDEWRRYGSGKWNYDSNEVRLKQFWKEGIQRASNEKIVSVGMRGDGDEPMSRETATALLERIVADQRNIIKEVTGKPANETPQLWALYKEVQDYYDKGMRVPDDVTLLLCDDNWGNLRKLPKLNEPKRSGGYGIYYHFDYVGGPRNYKWINTNNLARVWEQMHLAHAYGVDKIWIVNVGDIKPMELPTSFFLDYAWNPERWNEDNLQDYYATWAAQQFGEKYAKEIGEVLHKYSQYAARRKPELLDEKTYSLLNYNEWESIVNEWKKLEADAEKINRLLPVECKDAFFQLVLHPVKAFANLHELYISVAKNKLYAAGSLGEANDYAKEAQRLYQKDSLITVEYHNIANGKWNHMMDQTHIGYTYWQQPPVNKMPTTTYLPRNKWVDSALTIYTSSKSAKKLLPKAKRTNIFYEENGVVSIEAEHWTRAVSSQNRKWKVIPNIGKTKSGVSTFPVTSASIQYASNNTPHLEYDFYTYDSGDVYINAYFSPTLNFFNDDGLKYAVLIDDEQGPVISVNKEAGSKAWEEWVANNIIATKTVHIVAKPGKHTLKYFMISPAVVLQKLVLDFGGLRPSYLGPPETKQK